MNINKRIKLSGISILCLTHSIRKVTLKPRNGITLVTLVMVLVCIHILGQGTYAQAEHRIVWLLLSAQNNTIWGNVLG